MLQKDSPGHERVCGLEYPKKVINKNTPNTTKTTEKIEEFVRKMFVVKVPRKSASNTASR